jgi:hypothetical protein
VLLFPALTPGSALRFIKDKETLHRQVADPATSKGLLSYHKVTNHAVHNVSCSEEFQDFFSFPEVNGMCSRYKRVFVTVVKQDYFKTYFRGIYEKSHFARTMYNTRHPTYCTYLQQ